MIFYSDASFSHTRKVAGIACVAVDGNEVVNLITKKVTALDPIDAELKGIYENIRFAKRTAKKGETITLFSDCALAVNMIGNPRQTPARYYEIVADIIKIKGDLKIEWGRRCGNGQADALANLALRHNIEGLVTSVEPTFSI